MRHRIAALFALVAFATVAAEAQSSHIVTLRLDNDAFNFWRTPGSRPDEEYTSGVHLTYDGPSAPWWARGLTRSLADCTPGADRCRARRLEFGQHIYTPRRTQDSAAAPPGSRPNAGWLYIEEAARVLRQRTANEFSVALGVTGEPALAQFTQRVAHAFAPTFNRPTDWSEQIAFEPGIIARYTHTRRYRSGGLDILPRAHVELGNISTALEAGLRARTGVHLRHPWLPADRDAPVELAITAGATGRIVVRDLFLDGNTFRSGPRVGHEPFVYSGDWLLSARHRWLTISYGAVVESRAYPNGPKSHVWSSMIVAISFVR